jgi:LAO/AO transport system kinase
MTDMFCLLQLPNAGDDLQAIKKGVMELADLVVINKADIDVNAATRARAQITSALRLRPARQPRARPPPGRPVAPRGAAAQRAQEHRRAEFWQTVSRYRALQQRSGRLAARRHAQDEAWMWERIDAGLKALFRSHAQVREALAPLTTEVRAGRVAASVAARRLLDLFH